MEATSEKTQSQFPARFLFSTTCEQMSQLDELMNAMPGTNRLTVARAALAIGLAYIKQTGAAPLTTKAAKEAALQMAGAAH